MTKYRAHCQEPQKCRAVTHGHCSRCKPIARRAENRRQKAKAKKQT